MLTTFASDLFDFSFAYPDGWRLSEEGKEITLTVPGTTARVTVSIHILTTPQNVSDYTESALKSLEEEHPSLEIRSTAGRQVGEVPGLLNRAQATTDDGRVTQFKVYTAAIGRVGVTFVLSGTEADVASVEGQFDSLANSALFPSGSLEIPEFAIGKQAVGTSPSAARDTGLGQAGVFERGGDVLYAVVEFQNLAVDANVDFVWVAVDRFAAVEQPLEITETRADGDVHWARIAPAEGLEVGFYLVVVRVDESIITYLPYTVVNQAGAEFEEADAYIDWTGFLLNVRDFEQAIYAATKSIELDPTQAQPYIWRAYAYEMQCKIGPALADHSEAVRLLPNNPVTVSTRGQAYWYSFDHQRAMADYTRALELAAELPTDTAAQQDRVNSLYASNYNNRALVLADVGQFGEALADVNRALEISPDAAHFIDTKAYILLRSGQAAAAKVEYEKLLAMPFDISYIYLGMGLAQTGLDERNAARANLEHGLALFEEEDRMDCPDPQLSYLLQNARSTLAGLSS